ncbi:MAG: hypothetical protein WC717_06270 [Candidatus Micrarchaeia archaeon]|jgi:hypothetical protein
MNKKEVIGMEASAKNGMAQSYFACKLAEKRFTRRDAKQIYFACIRAHEKKIPLREDWSYIDATAGIINLGRSQASPGQVEFLDQDKAKMASRISEIMKSECNRLESDIKKIRLGHFFHDFHEAWKYGINGVRLRFLFHDLKTDRKHRDFYLDEITRIVRAKLAETLMD